MSAEAVSALQATAEAAYAIEFASSSALRAMCITAPSEIVRMTWILGWLTGKRDAYADVQRMIP